MARGTIDFRIRTGKQLQRLGTIGDGLKTVSIAF
jgi:hypothetical protein